MVWPSPRMSESLGGGPFGWHAAQPGTWFTPGGGSVLSQPSSLTTPAMEPVVAGSMGGSLDWVDWPPEPGAGAAFPPPAESDLPQPAMSANARYSASAVVRMRPP